MAIRAAEVCFRLGQAAFAGAAVTLVVVAFTPVGLASGGPVVQGCILAGIAFLSVASVLFTKRSRELDREWEDEDRESG